MVLTWIVAEKVVRKSHNVEAFWRYKRTRMPEKSNGVWERNNKDRDSSSKHFGLSHWKDTVTEMGRLWGGWSENQQSNCGCALFERPIQFLSGRIYEGGILNLGFWSSRERVGCKHKPGRCQNIDCPSLSEHKWLNITQTKQSYCTVSVTHFYRASSGLCNVLVVSKINKHIICSPSPKPFQRSCQHFQNSSYLSNMKKEKPPEEKGFYCFLKISVFLL